MKSNDKRMTGSVVPMSTAPEQVVSADPVTDDDRPVELASARGRPRQVSAQRFLANARIVSDLAAGASLDVPVFRSPPRSAELDRSITRRRGGVVVAVRRRGRPIEAIQADLIEGVVVANGLDPLAASAFRRGSWAALSGGRQSSDRRSRSEVEPQEEDGNTERLSAA